MGILLLGASSALVLIILFVVYSHGLSTNRILHLGVRMTDSIYWLLSTFDSGKGRVKEPKEFRQMLRSSTVRLVQDEEGNTGRISFEQQN